MKNISTGTGIALLAGAIVAYPILDRVMPKADASTTHAAAVAAAATAQAEPTIVWYGSVWDNSWSRVRVLRAWANGRVEARSYQAHQSECSLLSSCGPWQLLSDSSQGYSYRSDINFDSKVDGADLGQLLADWGDAPRQDIPPSDCPLALINP
jgi:hypothetical protein